MNPLTAPSKFALLACLLVFAGDFALAQLAGEKAPAASAPWPLYGGSPQRNMANVFDKNVAADWSIEEGKRRNIKWVAELGNRSYGGPVIAGGRVFVGTNNAVPRNPKIKGKKAVLMAFNEADGKFLWQNVHDIPEDPIFEMVLDFGLLSTPAVDGVRICYVTPSCEVFCADTADGKILWHYDMMKELKVVPFHCGNCSPLVAGDLVFLVTSNGRGEDGKVASPNAPSFIALNKKTGALAWQNNLPGENILEGQWSNPTLASVGGKRQVIFPGGDDFLYGLEPETGKLIWKFRLNPGARASVKMTQAYPIATPVVYEEKVYLGLGIYPDHPEPIRVSHFVCVDITRTGDISSKSLDHKAAENKGSGLVWAYGGAFQPKPKTGRTVAFGPTLSTAAIHDGLVYISEEAGYMHCLDARTGEKYWEHDFKTGLWGSAYYVDGKVYQGLEDGTVVIFEAGKKNKVIRQIDMEETIHGTPVVANGVLYIGTKSKLYAIAEKN
jgi:outer membrane protein assembly factor BamB